MMHGTTNIKFICYVLLRADLHAWALVFSYVYRYLLSCHVIFFVRFIAFQ